MCGEELTTKGFSLHTCLMCFSRKGGEKKGKKGGEEKKKTLIFVSHLS